MKKFRFLLLDAGPIIKLFELDLWNTLLSQCDVTICRTVVDEAKWASQEFEDIQIDLDGDVREGRIRIEEVELSEVKHFHDRLGPSYGPMVHAGEKETLAFLCNSPDQWLVCTADGSVFRTLGFLARSEQGVSLEKVLDQIGLGRPLEWKFTERFRKKYTDLGQRDAVQQQDSP